jgi:hypothetical protein
VQAGIGETAADESDSALGNLADGAGAVHVTDISRSGQQIRYPALRSGVPTRFSAGTRIVENVWQKGEAPEINRIGFAGTPGLAMSNNKKLMPRCHIRKVPGRKNPVCLVGIKAGPHLWPLICYSAPSRMADVRRLPGSGAGTGSE